MSRLHFIFIAVGIVAGTSNCLAQTSPQPITIRDGISLHYAEQGKGEPIIFVHGAIGDYSVWAKQLDAFADEGFRAISYSRRYNFPNNNELRPNHSALVETRDLVALIDELKLGKVHIVGHSAGAYISLVTTLDHPEKIRTLTLCEPPLISWLASLPGNTRTEGLNYLRQLGSQRVVPVKEAFAAGDEKGAVRAFVDSFAGSGKFDLLPRTEQDNRVRNSRELRAIMSTPRPYPHVDRDRVRQLNVPTLLLSADATTATSKLTDPELERLLPRETSKRVVLKGARHIMWTDQPNECKDAVLSFIRQHEDIAAK